MTCVHNRSLEGRICRFSPTLCDLNLPYAMASESQLTGNATVKLSPLRHLCNCAMLTSSQPFSAFSSLAWSQTLRSYNLIMNYRVQLCSVYLQVCFQCHFKACNFSHGCSSGVEYMSGVSEALSSASNVHIRMSVHTHTYVTSQKMAVPNFMFL